MSEKNSTNGKPPLHGLIAEFESPADLVAAVRKVREEGYSHFEAYTPFPVHGLSDAAGLRPTRLPLIVLGGGIAGCIAGFFLQYYASVIAYPINVGGRPLNSWPSFIPITFEMTVLVAALSAVLGMLALNGLPRPHHPVFNVPRFELASRSSFFLSIEAADSRFDRDQTRLFLEGLKARGVYEIED